MGQATTKDFTKNPEDAMKAMAALEYGIKSQEKAKEGQIQGEDMK